MTPLQKHYFALLWQHKGMALLGVLLAVITAIAGIALLAVSGWFISAAALAGLTAVSAIEFNFFTPGAMVRGFSITRTLGRYGERYTSHEATFRVISRLRADLFRLLARRHWQEVQMNRHESASRLLQDIQHIESIYVSALLPAVVVLATTAGLVISLALLLPQALPWALPLLVLAVVVMPWLYTRQVLQPQNQLHQLRVAQWQFASSVLSSMRTLSLHQQLEHSGEQMTLQAQAGDQQEIATVNRQQCSILLAQSCLTLLAVVVFWQAVVAYQQGIVAGADVFMWLLLTLGCGEVLIGASPILASLRLGLAALLRLEALQSAQTGTDLRQLTAGEGLIQLQQLSYGYPSQPQPVFQQLEVSFTAPGWYWVCGASGSGKSTLIALLAGQLQATSGVVRIRSASGRQPALMPQRIDILRASLRDNLCLHHDHSDEAIMAVLHLVELDYWTQSLPQGLDTWLGDGEWQPSGGETKRIGLARLLLQDADIMLLDEPAAGMDTALAERIFARLAQRWAGKLVIANTHDRQLMRSGQLLVEVGRSAFTCKTVR
ncbi:ATP-binding cassette domain-containing protein [Pokkaliibacter sp. MBI-7]|uniref:amino acid ABC transporter ATP-binding/permease protein n=1 Tax=Pokkaliibacter sp. MBI-7 TaxID=3040600 RepID=UPI0024472FD6|nr:ATP-binding cassette domain-containing protein [Pokkaliibacter sp. MBI-7]MDH2432450.1 ATP-binding cassette domain-containing protein [Pokkaliibacter sp. MBI-7]